MKKSILMSLLFTICFLPANTMGFSLWKTCFDFDESSKKKLKKDVLHKILDVDILKVWNQSNYSLAIVKCFTGRGRHAFSRFEDGDPLYPNSSVRIPNDHGEICEGDTIYVYEKECHILSLSKSKRLE